MQRRFLFISLILVVCHTAPMHAQTTISGAVYSENNVSFPGANVYIEGTYDGTSSDISGRFSFTTTLKDSFTVKASFIGFNDFSQKIYVDADTLYLDIYLTEHINYLDEVVISTGTFEAGSQNKSEIL